MPIMWAPGYYIIRTMIVGTMFVASIQFLNIANYANILIALVVLNKRWMHFYCFIPISIAGILVPSATKFVKLLICQRVSRKSDCTCHYFSYNFNWQSILSVAYYDKELLQLWKNSHCTNGFIGKEIVHLIILSMSLVAISSVLETIDYAKHHTAPAVL